MLSVTDWRAMGKTRKTKHLTQCRLVPGICIPLDISHTIYCIQLSLVEWQTTHFYFLICAASDCNLTQHSHQENQAMPLLFCQIAGKDGLLMQKPGKTDTTFQCPYQFSIWLQFNPTQLPGKTNRHHTYEMSTKYLFELSGDHCCSEVEKSLCEPQLGEVSVICHLGFIGWGCDTILIPLNGKSPHLLTITQPLGSDVSLSKFSVPYIPVSS